MCVDGQNACPPEDCGGVPGYADFLEVLADPTHDEHEHMRSWVGGPFDAEEFDLAFAERPVAGGALSQAVLLRARAALVVRSR